MGGTKIIRTNRFSQPKEVVKLPFEEVYKQYYEMVLNYYTKKMSNRVEAEDFVGDIFLYCYDHYDGYDPEKASVSTWIFMIAGSRFKNYCRDKKTQVNLDDVDYMMFAEEPDMEHSIWLEQLMDGLKDSLLQLTERQRQIVVLKFFAEKSAVEIGEMLGTNANNVRVQLSKALKLMQQSMQEYSV